MTGTNRMGAPARALAGGVLLLVVGVGTGLALGRRLT